MPVPFATQPRRVIEGSRCLRFGSVSQNPSLMLRVVTNPVFSRPCPTLIRKSGNFKTCAWPGVMNREFAMSVGDF